jgi:hypothetical protein
VSRFPVSPYNERCVLARYTMNIVRPLLFSIDFSTPHISQRHSYSLYDAPRQLAIKFDLFPVAVGMRHNDLVRTTYGKMSNIKSKVGKIFWYVQFQLPVRYGIHTDN